MEKDGKVKLTQFEMSTQISDLDTKKTLFSFIEKLVNEENVAKGSVKRLCLPPADTSNASFWSLIDFSEGVRRMGIKIILKDPQTNTSCANWGLVYCTTDSKWRPTTSIIACMEDNKFTISGTDSKYLVSMLAKHCPSNKNTKELKKYLETVLV